MGDAFLIQNIKKEEVLIAGNHYYLIRNTDTRQIHYYNLATPFNLDDSKVPNNADFILTVSGLTRVDNMEISNDGTIFYVGGSLNTNIIRYTLSTPFDLSTASNAISISNVTNSSELICFEIADEGRKLYVGSGGEGLIRQFTLSTPYDITTRTQTTTLGGFVSSGPGDPAFSPDGTKVVFGQRGGNIRGGTCSTPFDLATFTQTHTLNTSDADPSCAKWNTDGTKLYVRHASPDMINEFTTANPYTLGGMTFTRQVFNNPSYAAGGHEFNEVY